MLVLGLQNTHSGNISVRTRNNKFYITRTDTMKGHLEEDDIILLNLDEKRIKRYNASTETPVHQKILHSFSSVIHAHTISAVVLSNIYKKITPIDYLGKRFLKSIPLLVFGANSDTEKRGDIIAEKLRENPALVLKNHGSFVRGQSPEDAFFKLCVLDYSTEILLGIKMITPTFNSLPTFNFPLSENININKFKILKEKLDGGKYIQKISGDIFNLRLSPFYSGSISVRDGKYLIFSPSASLPSFIKNITFRIGIKSNNCSNFFLRLHQAVYQQTKAEAAIFTHSPLAMIQSIKSLADKKKYILPVDIEGKFLYPRIPVVNPDDTLIKIIKKAAKYKIVIIGGMGAISVGNSLKQSIRHSSVLRNICLIKTKMDIMKKLGMEVNDQNIGE